MIKVAIPTHPGDINLAINLAKQINTLGGASGHKCHVIASSKLANSEIEELKSLLKESFYSVEVSIVSAYEGRDPLAPSPAPYTQSANAMFRLTVSSLEDSKNDLPVLVLEPDTTILASDWLDKIESAYTHARAAGFHILGAKIPLRDYEHKIYRRRPPFAGLVRRLISVKQNKRDSYTPLPVVIPPNFSQLTELFKKSRFEPWEIQSRKELASKIQATSAIVHAHDSTKWVRTSGDTFTFTAPEEDKSPRITNLSGVVLVHGTKDNSLFEAYHEKSDVIEPLAADQVPVDLPAANETPAETPIEDDHDPKWEDSRDEASDPEFVEASPAPVMGVDTAFEGGDEPVVTGVVVEAPEVAVEAPEVEEKVDARKAALANRGKRR